MYACILFRCEKPFTRFNKLYLALHINKTLTTEIKIPSQGCFWHHLTCESSKDIKSMYNNDNVALLYLIKYKLTHPSLSRTLFGSLTAGQCFFWSIYLASETLYI